MRASVLGAMVGLVFGCALVAPVVSADAPAKNANQLVDEGLQLRSKGRDAEALERFEAAYALRPEARIRAQIALAEQALGHWEPARAHLADALTHRDDAWISRWRTELEGALRRVDSELGSIEVVSNVAGAAVLVDDQERGTTPLAQPLFGLPGAHMVRVQAPDFEPVTQTVDLQKGRRSLVEATLRHIEVAPPPAAAPAGAQPLVTQPEPAPSPLLEPAPLHAARTTDAAPTHHRPLARRTGFLVSAASVAVASFAAGGATYAMAGNKSQALKKDCYQAACPADEREERRKTVQRLDRTSWGLLSVGAATVIGTGIAYLVSREPPSAPRAAGMALGAAVDRTSAVLSGSMEF